MDSLELLTRATIWFAVMAWAWVLGARMLQRTTGARTLWTLGAVFYVIHALLAFHRFYDWSHAVAVAETARQTEEATGFASGSGLWLNYLLGLLWVADVLFWWRRGDDAYLSRPRWWSLGLDGFFAFMIFNGTVVFGQGAVQWFGAVIFVILIVLGVLVFRSSKAR